MKYIILFFLTLVALLPSCLKENKIIIKHDFENPGDGWNKISLLDNGAHSGKYYSYTDSINVFSSGFAKRLSDITPLKIKRIDAAVWIRKADYNSIADLIISLERDTSMVFYKSTPTSSAFPEYNEWTRMFVSFDLPDSVGTNENLKVYFYNGNKFPMHFDDFEIRLFTE